MILRTRLKPKGLVPQTRGRNRQINRLLGHIYAQYSNNSKNRHEDFISTAKFYTHKSNTKPPENLLKSF